MGAEDGAGTRLGVGGPRWVLPAECGSSSSRHEVPAPPLEGGGHRGSGLRGDGLHGDGQQGDGHCGDGHRGDGPRGDGPHGDGQRGDGPRVGLRPWRGCWEHDGAAACVEAWSVLCQRRGGPAQDP